MLALGVGSRPLLGFAFSWSWPTDYSFVGVYGIGAAAIYFHLLGVEPARERVLRPRSRRAARSSASPSRSGSTCSAPGAQGDELYMSHLYPPALRVARPPPGRRAESTELAPLQAELDRKAREPASADAGDPTRKERR